MKRILGLLVLWFMADSCLAATAIEPARSTRTDAESSGLPLARFMSKSEAVTLRSVKDQYELSFPVAERHRVAKAGLHLEMVNSNALIGHRSQLRVLLNGWHVAQIKLDPANPNTQADVALPVDRIRPGYNVLRFVSAQHYTDEHCEFPDSPELWTEIDTVKSTLSLSTVPVALQPTLGDLNRLLTETLRDYELNIAHAGELKTDEQLSWGGLIAQGTALRLKYAPIRINLHRMPAGEGHGDGSFVPPATGSEDASTDWVLIGSRASLASHLNAETLEHITGPYLGIFARPDKPGTFLLVVSGTTDAEVSQAAKSFTRINFPFPDTADTIIRLQPSPPVKPYGSPGMLAEGQAFSFAQLGFTTSSFEAIEDNPKDIKLIMPPDLYAPEDAQVELWLHVAYRAALRRDSVINVMLNGHFERAVHLKEESGGEYRGYRLSIPLRSFKPGVNILSFQAVPTPLVTGECLYIQGQQYVTLFDDSVIQLPDAAHYAKLPDLDLLARTGFPFTRMPDGSEAGIQILDESPQSLSSAWQLLGKLAQLNGAPLWAARISRQAIQEDRHLILVGRDQDLKQADQGEAPVRLSDPNLIRYTTAQVTPPTTSTWWQKLGRSLLADEAPPPTAATPFHADLNVTGGLGDYRLAMAYPSATHSDRLVLSVVAKTPESLLNGMQMLTTPEYWYSMKGDVVVWKEKPESLVWQDSGNAFFIGQAKPQLRLAAYFSHHPVYWVGGIVLLLAVSAWFAHRLLKAFKQRHHGDVEEFES